MKIVFLDIDGVMNSEIYYKSINTKVKDWDRFKPEAVKLLKQLLDEFNAKIVITSSWRFGAKELLIKELTKSGLKKYLHKNWKTAMLQGGERGKEIRLWLENNSGIENYVIFDDAETMLEEQSQNFIRTNISNGLEMEHYIRAREILIND